MFMAVGVVVESMVSGGMDHVWHDSGEPVLGSLVTLS